MARFVRSGDVVVRRIAGELVLVPIVRGASKGARAASSFHVLNATGEFLWNQLDGPADLEELVRRLIDEYDIDAETARRDVTLFLADLSSCGAIQVSELS